MRKRKEQDKQNDKEVLSDRMLWVFSEIMRAFWHFDAAIRPSKEVRSEAEMEELEQAAKHLERTLEAALEALRGRKQDPRWKLENR